MTFYWARQAYSTVKKTRPQACSENQVPTVTECRGTQWKPDAGVGQVQNLIFITAFKQQKVNKELNMAYKSKTTLIEAQYDPINKTKNRP